MTAMANRNNGAMPVEFKLNGKDVVGYGNETILQTAKRLGIEIPHLCYKEGMRPDGNCRACMVEIKGERVLAPSCCRNPTRAWKSRRTACARSQSRKWCSSCCCRTCRKSAHTLNSELD